MTWDEIRDKLTRKFPNLRPALADELASYCLRLYEQGKEDGAKEVRRMLEQIPQALRRDE